MRTHPAPRSVARRAGVVVPIRSFTGGKQRLAPVLDPDRLEALGTELAERARAAAGGLPVVVVSSAPEVRRWAARRDVTLLTDPGTLDAAAAAGLAWCEEAGLERAVVVHADLPLLAPGSLLRFGADGDRPVAAIVPSHRDDGTPVLALPVRAAPFPFRYGPGSFHRHRQALAARGLGVRVVRDPTFRFDLDLADDLHAVGLHTVGLHAVGRR